MQKKTSLVSDKREINGLINHIRNEKSKKLHLRVSTEITAKNKTQQIYVGSLIRGEELARRNPLFCTRDELIFYRHVKNWNDVFSYKEETISLNISIFHFLVENNIRLVITYAEDEARLNISPVEKYRFESDLGIGFLRRAKTFDTISLINSTDLNFSDYLFTKTVVAEKRNRTKQAVKPTEKKTASVNLNQGGLFD